MTWRSPVLLGPPSIRASAGTGYGPGSLSPGSEKVTLTLACVPGTTLYGMPMGSPWYRPEPKSACRCEPAPMLFTMLVEFGSTGRSDAVPRQNEFAGVMLHDVPPFSGENGMHPDATSP